MKITIPVPTYRTNVEVIISGKQSKLDAIDLKISKKHGHESDGFDVAGRAYAVYLKKGVRTATVVIRREELSFGVIAHEVMHCVFYIMNYIDIVLCYESEEAFTCLNQYLIEAIHRELRSKI